MGSLVKSVGKTVSGFLGAGGSAPRINAPSFTGIRTPALSLSPQGVLTRTDQFVPQAEQNILASLTANRAANLARLPGINALKERANQLNQRTSGFFERTAGLTGRLTNQLDELRPGFGRITESRVQGVRNAASQAVGNVRTAFGKRNLLGANFATREIANVQQAFAQEEDRVRAESLVQEYQAQQQIINGIGQLLSLDQNTLQQQAGTIALQLGLDQAQGQVFAENLANIQSELAVVQSRVSRELNELGVSGNIINRVNAIAADVAKAQAKLEAENAIQAGQSFSSGVEGLAGITDLVAPFFRGSESILSKNFTGSADAGNQAQLLAMAAAMA